MKVSVIIPVYKRHEWIGKCIEKLREQIYNESFEIVIVDDGSPDDSVLIKAVNTAQNKAGDLSIRYFRNNHAGPAAARNYGARNAKGEIYCFLDDDSVPDKFWMQEITRPFMKSDAAAVVSGRTCSLDRQNSFPLLLEKTVYAGKSWATCNIAYRRDVFEALGGFDETFSEPSWEDNDLGMRARWAGYSHKYAERAIVYHPHERTLREYKAKCLLNGRGAAVFSRKYLSRKPLWSIVTPLLMARRLVFAFCPDAWLKREQSPRYLSLLWSFYSLQGYWEILIGGKNE